MDLGAMIRDARGAAGITQVELADYAGTAQSAVAAYESGARKPNIATLERLLAACEYDLEMFTHPRVRRGAISLAQLVPILRGELEHGGERHALRLLFGFTDDFRGSSRPGQISLFEDAPDATGDARFDAMLAGIAEFFALESAIAAPDWVQDPSRFLKSWWFVASRPGLHAYTLANTPAAFFRHGVFVAREVFDRV